jgi:restriction endonuclease S subunit
MQRLFSVGIGHSEFKESELRIVYPLRKIPKTWEIKTLSDITTQITDGAHFTPTYTTTGIPFLRVTDLKSKNLLDSAIKYIPKEEHDELIKRCKPERGDILYSKNGTIGLTRFVNWDWEFSIFVSLCLIKPNRELINPIYLKHYLESNIVNDQIRIRSKQGTVTNLHLEEIGEFFIPFPPLEEQKQIAEILSTIDEKLEILRAKKEAFETLKKGLMQKLLNGEVRVNV